MGQVDQTKATTLVAFENVSVTYDLPQRKTLTALHRVSLRITAGETVGLIGESGSGKSTLARALVGLAPLAKGDIWFEGEPMSRMNRKQRRSYHQKVQMVFQDPHSALDPRRTVIQSVREPLEVLHVGDAKSRDRFARDSLEQVELSSSVSDRYPHQLSGGQKQRVNIARALITRPQLLICDESVAALDVALQAEILNLLSDLKNTLSLSMLFISHDLSVVAHLADRIAVMYLGEIVEEAPANEMMSTPRHPYTEALIRAEPRIDAFLQPIRTESILRGDIPSPISPPEGCRFHTRCPEVQPVCKVETPTLRGIGPDRATACLRVHELYAGSPEPGASQ